MRRRIVVLLAAMATIVAVPIVGVHADTGDPSVVQVCGPQPDGYAQCMAEAVAANKAGSAPAQSPAQIKSIYYFPTSMTLGAGQTVAIVSAFDAPTMEADLGVFDTQFGLPPCTKANGCFTELNQTGGTTLPSATDDHWSTETHLDVEWAHAIAPGAKIVLVETNDNVLSNLIQGDDAARTQGRYVSNSWGVPEGAPETVVDHHFTDVPGVSFFFATGDNGAAVPQYPAMSPNVVAVGGTTLQFTSNNGVFTTEIGWSGSGGGCSQFETASAAQAANPGYNKMGCAGKRAIPDVASVADPNTGVAVYDSQNVPGLGVGWVQIGGTSAATPIIAARAAGTGAQITQSRLYSGGYIGIREVNKGNNGFDAKSGYDLVAGLGTWIY